MPSFDAHAFEMIIAQAMMALALVITIGAVSVVRVVRVPNAPSRAGKK